MGRPSKIEISAINIRIPADKNRDYVSLLSAIAELKVGVRIFGNTYVAISQFSSSSMMGVLSKYTEIDIDGDWFDVNDFGLATPERVEEVIIPEGLRPNYSAFYFYLDKDLHIITFESYSESKSLSSLSVEKYFSKILETKTIIETFGRVEADVVRSYSAVEQMLALPDLKELRIVIRRPNPDDLSGGLAALVEARLREQNGEEYEEILRSSNGDGLNPNKRTKELSVVAAENGQVVAKSIVNGVIQTHNTDEKPLKEVETYNSETESSLNIFRRISDVILSKIREARRHLVQDANAEN